MPDGPIAFALQHWISRLPLRQIFEPLTSTDCSIVLPPCCCMHLRHPVSRIAGHFQEANRQASAIGLDDI
jgi:hypothetical protein